MFEELVNLVKKHAGSAIINNPAIPNERNEEAIQETSNSIAGGLQNMLKGGGIKDILNMFSGKHEAAASPVTNNISGGLIDNLMKKFNLDKGAASNIAGNLVPDVMKNLVHKTNDPNDKSFDIQGIFNKLSGGSTSGFNMQGLLDKFKGGGLDKDGDGDVDLQDLMKMVSGGGGTGGGGGLLDKIKGFFK